MKAIWIQDWGGQGPANMPTGNNCGELGTDRCAQITGSGNSTSTMGVSGMGTTFIQTVDISELDIENGGRTNYSIKVDKRDAQDRIYMHITGKNGNTSVFSWHGHIIRIWCNKWLSRIYRWF